MKVESNDYSVPIDYSKYKLVDVGGNKVATVAAKLLFSCLVSLTAMELK